MTRIERRSQLFSAQGATGFSRAVPVSDFKNITIALIAGNSANLVVKPLAGVKTSQTGTVDFSVAKSPTNIWGTVSFSDINDQSAIDGSTGITLNSDTATILEANVDGIDFFGLQVSSWTAGDVTAYVIAYSND